MIAKKKALAAYAKAEKESRARYFESAMGAPRLKQVRRERKNWLSNALGSLETSREKSSTERILDSIISPIGSEERSFATAINWLRRERRNRKLRGCQSTGERGWSATRRAAPARPNLTGAARGLARGQRSGLRRNEKRGRKPCGATRSAAERPEARPKGLRRNQKRG